MTADLRTRLDAYYATRERTRTMRLELARIAVEHGLDQATATSGNEAAAFLEGVLIQASRPRAVPA